MADPAPGFKHPYPDFSIFKNLYETRKPQLVMRRIIGDLHTPVGAYLKLAGEQPNCFLLESIEGGERLGRYSVIGLEPDLIWQADGNRAFINRAPDKSNDFEEDHLPTLDSLKALVSASHIALSDADKAQLPPMAAGLFGYFGYDTVRLVEKLPPRPPDARHMPDALFIRPKILVVFDNVRQEIFFISPIRPPGHQPPKDQGSTDTTKKAPISDHVDTAAAAYERVVQALAQAIGQLEAPALPSRSAARAAAHSPLSDIAGSDKTSADRTYPDKAGHDPIIRVNTSVSDYAAMVETAKEYIKAGDIFQVVLSQRFSMAFPYEPFELYRALRRLNPSPFLFFLNFSCGALVGSSPEILVRIRNKEVTIRPIAGTRKRGKTDEEDKALETDLLSDPKERAEHLMLLDLGRNDVGRTAKIGSVKVTDQFMIERYSHVMHIVSNVTGELGADCDPVDALMAGFPAGTVSGAPKIRAMEIIDALEHEARGPYGGCIGYFSADGNIDSCIALRTALVKDGVMHVQAGAGIVAESVPEQEQAECENKAGALIAAAKSCFS